MPENGVVSIHFYFVHRRLRNYFCQIFGHASTLLRARSSRKHVCFAFVARTIPMSRSWNLQFQDAKIHVKLLRNGIFAHLNHVLTVSAVNAST